MPNAFVVFPEPVPPSHRGLAAPALAPAEAGIYVEIGGIAVRFSTSHAAFLQTLGEYYSAFAPQSAPDEPFELGIETTACCVGSGQDVLVECDGAHWRFSRSGFEAVCCLDNGIGRVRAVKLHTYYTDLALRILHTLLLPPRGGFVLHAASHIRNGRAFIFTGVSGAGKTTISRLAPPDSRILGDEVSLVCPKDGRYFAFGTPFVSSFGKPGENICAPVEAVYLLAHGPENRCEHLSGSDAAGALLRNLVFFASAPDLVNVVFAAACDFLSRIPVFRLTFVPDPRVWELIR